MKLTIAIVIFATLFGFSKALKDQREVICAKFTTADNLLKKLEFKGISIRQLPVEKLIWIKNTMRNGVEKGCSEPVKTATVKCKRFTARGRSVVCTN